MDTISSIISFIALVVFLVYLVRGIIGVLRKNENTKTLFKRSLIAFAVFIVGVIVFGMTTDLPKETAKEAEQPKQEKLKQDESKQEQSKQDEPEQEKIKKDEPKQKEEERSAKEDVKQKTEPAVVQPKEEKKEEKSEPKKEEVKKEKPVKKEGNKIDTSVFEYAKKVEVTDARDITKHINLVVHMSEELTPGLATRHVFYQTYDFLQQNDIKGADTVTVGVMQGDIRVAQITVDVKKFQPDDQIIQSVLKAATIDKMRPEVKEFGKVMNLW
ncbi:hypothetical protein PK52_gp20 [Geobacillus phage vB_GthS_PK5.2]|nr:hypothetical protein PK52_gp20 [Geobacillus phage vB_GthS_PK5.2]